MDGNLASRKALASRGKIYSHFFTATYTLIHAFLTKQSHIKAAQAVKKAAKEVVILKDDVELEGPQLDEIIRDWKAASQKKEESSE